VRTPLFCAYVPFALCTWGPWKLNRKGGDWWWSAAEGESKGDLRGNMAKNYWLNINLKHENKNYNHDRKKKSRNKNTTKPKEATRSPLSVTNFVTDVQFQHIKQNFLSNFSVQHYAKHLWAWRSLLPCAFSFYWIYVKHTYINRYVYLKCSFPQDVQFQALCYVWYHINLWKCNLRLFCDLN